MQEEIKKEHRIGKSRKKFKKTGPNVKFEYENSIFAQEISDKTDTFKTPKVKNLENNWLTFKFVEGLNELHELQNDSEFFKLIKKAGIALANIHKLGINNKSNLKLLKYKFDIESYRKGFIHGDFNLENVMTKDGKIFIIDWHASPILQTSGGVGPQAKDIYWFIRDIYFKSGWSVLYSVKANTCIDIFLNAYMTIMPINMYNLIKIGQELEKKYISNYYVNASFWIKSKVLLFLFNRKVNRLWINDFQRSKDFVQISIE